MAYRHRSQPMCRHCYVYGHTKRSCPKVKEIIAQNPNSYLAENMKRKCSYCRTSGHTKVKCPEYAERQRQWRIQILEQRTNMCNALTDMGIAPGALIKCETYIPYDNAKRSRGWHHLPAIVNRVLWDSITRNYSDALEVIFPETNTKTSVRAPKHEMIRDNFADTVLLAPVSKEIAKQYNEREMEKHNEKVIKDNAK